MKILAIDTANSYLSLALYTHENCYSYCENIGNKQTEFILPTIEKILKDHDTKLSELTAIAYNAGPGGFTGLRICLSTAMSLAYSLNIPLYPITMFAMYHELLQTQEKLLVCLDAKLGQIYLAGYNEDGSYLLEPCLINPEELADRLETSNLINERLLITGSGWVEYQQFFSNDEKLKKLKYIESDYPLATTMVNLVLSGKITSCSPQNAELLYLRNKVAMNLEEQKLAKNK